MRTTTVSGSDSLMRRSSSRPSMSGSRKSSRTRSTPVAPFRALQRRPAPRPRHSHLPRGGRGETSGSGLHRRRRARSRGPRADLKPREGRPSPVGCRWCRRPERGGGKRRRGSGRADLRWRPPGPRARTALREAGRCSLSGTAPQLGGEIRCHENDGAPRAVAPQDVGESQPIHARVVVIQESHRSARAALESLAGVGRNLDTVAALPQTLGGRPAHELVIVYDEDRLSVRGPALHDASPPR